MRFMESHQLTLGGLMDALDAVPRDAQLFVSGFGGAGCRAGDSRDPGPCEFLVAAGGSPY